VNNPQEGLQLFARERLIRFMRRWGILVLAGAAIAGVAAFTVSKLTPPTYRATAQLFLTPGSNPSIAFQDVVLGQNLARSYVQLATADVVLSPALQTVSWPGLLKEFRDRVQVSQLRDTSVIEISFRDVDPILAAAAANAIADSFITRTKELQQTLQGSTTTELEDQIAAVQKDIRALDDQVTRLNAQLVATPRPGQTATPRSETEAQILQAENIRDSKQQTFAQLVKTRDDMRLAAARAQNTVSLWQTAAPPTQPESPRVLLNTALGIVLGVLVMLLVIGAFTYLDDRVTDLAEANPKLGLPGLAQVRLGENPASTQGKLFIRDAPRAPEAEAFRSLRTNLQFARVDNPPHSLLVTSAKAGEGKSVVSANLALAFAETGVPTILIDADLRRPSLHRLFRLTAAQGLTTLLTDATAIARIDQFRVSPQLSVIPSGPLPPNPAELLASERMSWLIKKLAATQPGAFVIIDTSPVLAVADPIALATKVDGCAFVIDAGHTHTSQIRHAIAALQRVHAPLLGVILNKVSSADAYYYYDYYNYAADAHRPAPRRVEDRPGA
jgi:non-specific protein-tyrosine kinase